jgi:hypothetical protein
MNVILQGDVVDVVGGGGGWTRKPELPTADAAVPAYFSGDS